MLEEVAAMVSGEASGEAKRWTRVPKWYRAAEAVLGLVSVVASVVVLANPAYGTPHLVALLAVALGAGALRSVVSGAVRRRLASVESAVHTGAGLAVLGILAVVLFLPGVGFRSVVLLVAVGLSLQGLGRLYHAVGRDHPPWVRGSAAATGAFALFLVGVALVFPWPADFTLVALLSVITFVNGLEGIVSGLRPTNRRQLILLKLVLFSLAYGLLLINWIDLYATDAPAYHIWLVLTYMAPFGVLIVFQGFKDWQLALSLGLLVSLANDIGYYFVGNLLFGFDKPILPWVAGQLGFDGWRVLFHFQGGAFDIPVTSILMGVSIYVRVAVVFVVLLHWWRAPLRKPRNGTSVPTPASSVPSQGTG